LKIGFIAEAPFPTMEGMRTPIKDEIVSLLLDCPRCYDEEFHEIVGALAFGFFHHGVERQTIVPVDT
jgi:hypothetical protein